MGSLPSRGPSFESLGVPGITLNINHQLLLQIQRSEIVFLNQTLGFTKQLGNLNTRTSTNYYKKSKIFKKKPETA